VDDADRETLASLRTTTKDVLRSAFADQYAEAVLLDFPRHRNAGDSLIWAGERSYLRSLGVRVTYSSDSGRLNSALFDVKRRGAVVLFHGGGNLGDLWPGYQRFREQIISTIPQNRVVILSQSLFFNEAEAAKRANRVFAEHGNVSILLRDHESIARARVSLPDAHVVFCPDMAFGNELVRHERSPKYDYVITARGDRERSTDEVPSLESAVGPLDWESGMSRWKSAKYWLARSPGMAYRRLPRNARPVLEFLTQRSNDWMAGVNVESAQEIVSRGRVVVTDRLHVHILCTLLAIPHVVIDNSYGKIGAVFRAYSGKFSGANLARSVTEAEQVARALLARAT